MKIFLVLSIMAVLLVVVTLPAKAGIESPQIPDWVIKAGAPDYAISRSLYQDYQQYYVGAYRQISAAALGSGVAPTYMQRAMSEAYAKFSDARVKITPEGGGTIETGHTIAYGNSLPQIYRIQVVGSVPQVDYYYDPFALHIHITVSDGLNKVTYLATASGVQVLDASLPSIQANTSFVGLVGGTGVTITKNEIIRGLNVLAKFVNEQKGETGLCGGNVVSFMAIANAIMLDQMSMRQTLAAAIKTGKYNYRCAGKAVQLIF